MGNAIKETLGPEVHTRLKHLSVDLGRPMTQLLVDAAILLLRFHDRGKGLPEPELPAGRFSKEGGEG